MDGYPVKVIDKPHCYYVICDCGQKVYFFTNSETGKWDSVQHGENPEHTFICEDGYYDPNEEWQITLETDSMWNDYDVAHTKTTSTVSGKWIDAVHEREVNNVR